MASNNTATGMTKLRSRRIIAGLVAVGLMALAACSSDKESSSTAAPGTTGGSVTTAAPSATTQAPSATTTASTGSSAGTTAAPTQSTAAPSTTAATAKIGGSVNWLYGSDPATLHPKGLDTATSLIQWYSVYDSLTRINPKTDEVEYRLAASVTPNADDTEWTIKLRPNVTFSDGTPFNAAAVKANWDILKDPATAAKSQFVLGSFKSYDVVDDLTLKITLTGPRGAIPAFLARSSLGAIASPAALQKYGADYGTSAEAVVGAGPFVIKDWARGSSMNLVRNPTYWDAPRPYLDAMTITNFTDNNARAAAAQTQDNVLAWFPNADPAILQVKGNNKFTAVDVQPGNVFLGVDINQAEVPDLRVRQALVLATDPDEINTKASGGTAVPFTTFFEKGSTFYNPDLVQKHNDLAAAQKLIDAYVAEKGPVKLTLPAPDILIGKAQALQQQWQRLKDVEITLQQMTTQAYIAARNAGNFQINITSGPSNIPTYPEDWNTYFRTGGTWKSSDPELDKLLDAGLGATSVDDRKKALDAIAQRILDQALFVGIEYQEGLTVVTKNIEVGEMVSPRDPAPEQLSLSS
jgi:peptide/nickel transport system substrate-binding protein